MLKARILKTGEIVEICSYTKYDRTIGYYKNGTEYGTINVENIEFIGTNEQNNFSINYNKELFDLAKHLYMFNGMTIKGAFTSAKEFINKYKEEIENEKDSRKDK